MPIFSLRRPRSAAPSPAAAAAETRATAPFMALAPLGHPVWTPRDFGALSREGYQKNAIAYRCVRMVAEAVASVPLSVRDSAGDAHPLAQVLARPNPDQSLSELIEAFIGHLQISGNAYLELVAVDGRPREIAVLRPDRVRVIPGADGWPLGWEHGDGSNKRRLWREPVSGCSPVLHLKLFNPADDHYGQSPLEAAATSVDIHNAGGAWNKALIDNAARPSGALVYRGSPGAERLSEPQFERLKAELSAAHTGAANAGRPLLLEGGLEWTPMSLTPAEMDFVEARRAAARDIALALGVPPMLLGVPGDNTYANYKEANVAFWRVTVLPLVAKLCAALEHWLSPWAGQPVTVVANQDAVPALNSEREALWSRLSAAEFLTLDEKRALAGFSPKVTSLDGEDRA